MPDLQTTYRAVVAAARAQALTLTRASLRSLALDYAVLLAAVIEEAERSTGVQAERLTRRSAAVRAALDRVRQRVEGLETDARRAARIMGDGHTEAVRLAIAEAAPSYTLTTSFEAVPERAVEALLKRRQVAMGRGLDSYSRIFKSVAQDASQGVLESIDSALVRGVARGADTRTVAREIAARLSEGDPALRKAVETLSKSLQRSGRTLSSYADAAADLDDDLGRARALLHRARRLARSEILDAARVADAQAAHLSPVVSGLRWTLSGSHPPSGCECEVWAHVDLYRMGEGVFPTNAYPSAPHPSCACYSRAVTRGPAEWDSPKPAADRAAQLSAYPFETRTDGRPYSDAHRARVTASVNAQLATALRSGTPSLVPA